MIETGEVLRAVHASTGMNGVTPAGSFEVYVKALLSWSVPFKVWMPYAAYFTGGIATHQSPNVPSYPASHGCVRLPEGEAPRSPRELRRRVGAVEDDQQRQALVSGKAVVVAGGDEDSLALRHPALLPLDLDLPLTVE